MFNVFFKILVNPCPMENTKVENPKEVGRHKKQDNWKKCAGKCQKNSKCKIWSYKEKTKTCFLFSKYTGLSDAEFYTTGLSDCTKGNHPLNKILYEFEVIM